MRTGPKPTGAHSGSHYPTSTKTDPPHGHCERGAGGRTVHIHFKIRTEPGGSSGLEFTSQLFFDDSFSDSVFAQDPYAAKGDRDTRNDNDGIYAQSGDQLTLAVTPDGDGYAATFDIGVQVS